MIAAVHTLITVTYIWHLGVKVKYSVFCFCVGCLLIQEVSMYFEVD